MNRFLVLAALAAALVLAACGGSSKPKPKPRTPVGGTTIAVKSIDGIGDVLVDSAGKALYSSDVEADGKVSCTGACTSFWEPLTVGSGAPTAASTAGKVSVVKRPDGARQVAIDGKPVYTFSEDAPGKLEGNGFSDDFDGHHFTWTAVLAGHKAAGTASGAAPGNDGGY